MNFNQKLDILNTLVNLNLIKCYILPSSLKLNFEKMNDVGEKDFFEHYNNILGYYDDNGKSEKIDDKTLKTIWKEIKKEKWDYVPIEDVKIMTFIGRKNFSIVGFTAKGYEKRKNDTYKYTIENENGLTIKDWVEGVYRCKADLHNYWNELFSKIEFEEGNEECEPEFNYGS